LDIQKAIYVAATPADIDGDGVNNSVERCLATPASNVDYDQDGIDDACDGFIARPLTIVPPGLRNSISPAKQITSMVTEQLSALLPIGIVTTSDTLSVASPQVLAAIKMSDSQPLRPAEYTIPLAHSSRKNRSVTFIVGVFLAAYFVRRIYRKRWRKSS
jgi:hypothetical protein